MKNAPIAYQNYSARKEAEQDLLSVLRQLKALGYDGVEFAGFYGHSAQDVRAMLEEWRPACRIQPCGAQAD